MLDGGDELWAGGKKVGVVTCAMHSRATKRSLAIAPLRRGRAKPGTKLEVKGKGVQVFRHREPDQFRRPGEEEAHGGLRLLRPPEEGPAPAVVPQVLARRTTPGAEILKPMLVQGIKSRPVYGTLEPRRRPRCISFVADGEGAQAILDLANPARRRASSTGRISSMFPPALRRSAMATALKALNPFMYYEGPTIAAALPRLAQTLANARWARRSISPAPRA